MRDALIKFLLHLLSLLPLRLNHALGGLIGSLMGLFPSGLRHVTRRNIGLCFPAMATRQQRRLARAALRTTAQTATETAAMWLWPHHKTLATVREIQGREHLDQALALGRGVIIAAPHIGAWELVGLYCAGLQPMTSLYRPLRIPALDSLVRASRQRGGATLVPTDAGGIRSLYQALARNEMIGILPDQEPGAGSGVFAPFFGVPAYTMVLLTRLARKSGAPVVYCFAERLPRGCGYRLHFLPAPEGIDSPELEQAALALNKGVEQCVRIAPEQYQWAYKRFRTRPAGEGKVY